MSAQERIEGMKFQLRLAQKEHNALKRENASEEKISRNERLINEINAAMRCIKRAYGMAQ